MKWLKIKGHLLQTTNFVLQTNHSLPQFAAEFFFQVFDDGVDRGLDVGDSVPTREEATEEVRRALETSAASLVAAGHGGEAGPVQGAAARSGLVALRVIDRA